MPRLIGQGVKELERYDMLYLLHRAYSLFLQQGRGGPCTWGGQGPCSPAAGTLSPASDTRKSRLPRPGTNSSRACGKNAGPLQATRNSPWSRKSCLSKRENSSGHSHHYNSSPYCQQAAQAHNHGCLQAVSGRERPVHLAPSEQAQDAKQHDKCVQQQPASQQTAQLTELC